jgi:acyl-CoA synthetase (NDP forming)
MSDAPDAILARAAAEGRSVLLEPEVYALLTSEGIAVPEHRVVTGPDAVSREICAALPSPKAVVKVVSPDVPHKSDVGGVAFCDNSPSAVRSAVRFVIESTRQALPQADIRGALIAERVSLRDGFGREVLTGFRHDRAFGAVLFAGVGGLDTEVLNRVLRPEAARATWSVVGLEAAAIATGLRGTVIHEALCRGLRSAKGTAVTEPALVGTLLALARLAAAWGGFHPENGLGVDELEVNPLAATLDGRLVALDGLARLHRPAPLPAPRPAERLRHLLVPQSALVVGASAQEMNAGRIILRNLVEGGGIPRQRIWAIHPRATEIDGCRAFASTAQIPEPADMAVISVPAERGADAVVADLVERRLARTITLIAGGFGETEGGRAAEARVREVVDRAHRDPDGGVLVNGPNCLGIISVPGGYNTFFLPSYKLPFHDAPGQNVASISQSGAYLVTQISNLDRAVRPRYAISFGNQVDLTVADYLEYLAGDPFVRIFAVYLEGFRRGDGGRFLAAARRIVDEGRTVLLYKAGRTREGTAAAASHTASVVGDYEVCRELARAAGVLDCVTLDMFEDYLMTFAFLAGRRSAGRRVAVISNAGFECAAAADKLYGLRLAEFTAATRERLRTLLPRGIVDVHNPIDTTPITPTDLYAGCVEAVLDDPNVDAVVVAGVPATPYLENLARGDGHGEDIVRPSSLPSRLIRIFQSAAKPMVFSVDSGELYETCVQMMKRAGLPCFRKVDRATRALGAFLGAP